MSGILCVWVAELPESSEQWYEDEYIPEMMSRHSKRALLAEIVDTPLDKEFEGVATRDAEWKSLAAYEVEDVQKIVEATYDKSNHPVMEGPLRGSRFDVRPYELIKSWQGEAGWNGGGFVLFKFICNHVNAAVRHLLTTYRPDGADVASVLVWEWQPHRGFEKEVIDFYVNDVCPLFCMAPEILRLRWFKVTNATVLRGDSYDTLKSEDLHTYMTFVELDCEEWPWSELLVLNDLPQWVKYFEGQKAAKWQASHYVVKRSYPDSWAENQSKTV